MDTRRRSGSRIATGLAAIAAARATPYSRGTDAYSRTRGDQLGIGASPAECGAYLRPLITGGKLATDSALADLLDLANDTELAALRADPLTAQRIDEYLEG